MPVASDKANQRSGEVTWKLVWLPLGVIVNLYAEAFGTFVALIPELIEFKVLWHEALDRVTTGIAVTTPEALEVTVPQVPVTTQR